MTDLQRAKAIFVEAIEHDDPIRRRQFIDGACAGDEELRAKVDRLIQADERDSSLLDGDPFGPRSARLAEPASGQVGRYEILGEIGRGGMGVVYEARQFSPKRRVALKVLAGAPGREALSRFRREIHILGRLSHPNIARVFEAGMHDDGLGGRPYFAMELIEDACAIHQFAEQRQLVRQERIDLFMKVCEAVEHGHQRGIIHRDLKPSNILVGADGEPKVIDFGVAGVMDDAELSVVSAATTPGQLIGTLRYMSPEQFEPDGQLPHFQPGIRTDVYALGVVLYELLTNACPFPIDNLSPYDLPRVIREDDPIRPSAMVASLRGDLETIVLKAMSKDPGRRYASTAELADDLRRFQNRMPIAARPPSLPYVVRRFAQRHHSLMTTAGVALLVACLSIAIGSVLYVRSLESAETAQQKVDSLRRGIFAQVPPMESFFDGFQDGMYDSRFLPPTSPSAIMEKDGRLVFRNSGDTKSLLYDLDPAQYLIRGDFDIRVDFQLLDMPVPERGATHLVLAVVDPRTDAYRAAIRRYNEVDPGPRVPAEQTYSAGLNDKDHRFVSTTHQSGRLRLTRRGSTVAAYYDDEGWVLLYEGSTSDESVILRLLMHSFFHDEPTAAAFDNLIVDTVYPTEPRCLEPIIDEFDGECVDGRYLVQTTYGSPRERDGHLELIRESVVSGEIGLTLDPTRHMLCGDFDVQVRYRLDEYAAPRAGERTFALRIRSARAERLVAAVERGVSAHPRGDIGVDWFRTQHEGRSASRYHDAERSSGALRIVRTDGVVTLMSLEKDEWRTLSFAAVSDEPLYYEIMLGCSDDETRSVVRCDRLIVNTSVNGDPLNGDRELKGQ